MDEQNRSVRFSNQLNETDTISVEDRLKLKMQEKKPGLHATMEGIRWALDAAGNTCQYIRYANMKIDKHQEQIKNIHKLHKRFDREIAMLQSQKLEKIDLDKNSLSKMDIKSVTSVLDQLLLGKRNTKSKLKTLQNECALAEKELEQQELQIEDVREHLKETQSQGKVTFDIGNELTALKIIQEELNHLGKDYDITKLSDAIDVIISSVRSKY